MVTLPGQKHDNNSSYRWKSGENNPKKIESTAADEWKQQQDCWKQFVETDSKTLQAYGAQSWGICHEIKTIMQELKIRRGDDAIKD